MLPAINGSRLLVSTGESAKIGPWHEPGCRSESSLSAGRDKSCGPGQDGPSPPPGRTRSLSSPPPSTTLHEPRARILSSCLLVPADRRPVVVLRIAACPIGYAK